jgi:hypothetical protein
MTLRWIVAIEVERGARSKEQGARSKEQGARSKEQDIMNSTYYIYRLINSFFEVAK